MTQFDKKVNEKLSFRKKLFFKFMIIFISVSTILILGEITVRLWVTISKRTPLTISDRQTGWRLVPNLSNQIRVDKSGQYVISTNATGIRLSSGEDPGKQPKTPAVILVGDSFVQGVGVDDKDTFAWLIAQKNSWRVVNLGVLGYGTDQELLRLESYLNEHPDLEVRDVLVFVFDNDFDDVQNKYEFWLGRSKPFFHVNNGLLEQEPFKLGITDHLMDVSQLFWFFNSKRGFIFSKPQHDPNLGITVVTKSLASMRTLTNQRSARFHVVLHRRLKNPEPSSEPKWEEFIKISGAIDITERLKISGGADPVGYDGLHWSAEGHQRVAAVIEEMINSPRE